MSPLDAPVRRGRWVICFHEQDSSRTPLAIAWLYGAIQIVQIKSGFLRALIQISLTQDVIKRRCVIQRTTRWEVYHGCI